jgi:ketosteroid isomerase-like protein
MLLPMDSVYKDQLLSKVRSFTSDPPDHQAVLHSAYDAVVHGRFDDFAASLTEDVQLHISGLQEMDGIWRGRDAVADATRKNFGMVDAQQPEIEHMITQGNVVAVLLRESGTFRADGRAYSVRAVQWFAFTDGKISRIDEIAAPWVK